MNSPHKVFSLRAVVQMLFFVVAVPFLPLLISRRWDILPHVIILLWR